MSGSELTASYAGSDPEELTFEWFTNGQMLTESNLSSSQLVFPDPGVKTIALETTTSFGCVALEEIEVTVTKTPTAFFEAETVYCGSPSGTITYSGNASEAATFDWDFGAASFSGTGSGPYEVIFPTEGEHQIALSVTEAGCGSAYSKIVYYYSYPNLELEFPGAVCFNQKATVELTSPVTNVGWDFNDALVEAGSGTGPFTLSWSGAGQKFIFVTVSNHECFKDTLISIMVAPELSVPELCIVSVDSLTGKNKLHWNYSPEMLHFVVYRESNTANHFLAVDTIAGAGKVVYSDIQSEPRQVSNRYRISVLDTCGNESLPSGYHKTIHLNINKGQGDSWNLLWDAYEGFEFGTYKIYAANAGQGFQLLGEVPSNVFSYTDENSEGESRIYQIVVEAERSCNIEGRTKALTQSRSNIAYTGITAIENTFQNQIQVYPNPATHALYVDCDKPVDVTGFAIYSLHGRCLMQGGVLEGTMIDVRSLTRGVYMVRLDVLNKGVIFRKFIKE